MKRDKYMGMDVHQATTVVAVIDAEGKIVLETIVPTAAGPIRRLTESISGPVHVTLEETSQAEWLHDLLQGSHPLFSAHATMADEFGLMKCSTSISNTISSLRLLARVLPTTAPHSPIAVHSLPK
jgi:hypothetical protein